MSPKQQPTTSTTPAASDEKPTVIGFDPAVVSGVKTCEEQIAAVQADAATANAEANAIVTKLLVAIKLALSRAPYDELKVPLHQARREAGAFLGINET